MSIYATFATEVQLGYWSITVAGDTGHVFRVSIAAAGEVESSMFLHVGA